MTRRSRALDAGVMTTWILCLVVGHASAADSMQRTTWCDLDLDAIFGVIADVATDRSGRVFLLDEQLKTVHVLSADGQNATTMGREGEGPGEFWTPVRLAASSSGAVTVYQSFHALPVAFNDRGRVAAAPRMERLRAGWTTTDVFRAALLDDGSHVLAVLRIRLDPSRPDRLPESLHELVHLSASGDRVRVLLSSDPSRADDAAIGGPGVEFAVSAAWDVDPDGRLVFLDGRGPGTVTIWSIHDDSMEQLQIEIDDQVESESASIEREYGIAPGALPRIGSFSWAGDGDRILLQSTAARHAERQGRAWIEVESHDLRSGERTVERLDVRDSAKDLIALRGGALVIVEGARALRREFYDALERALDGGAAPLPPVASGLSDESMCVHRIVFGAVGP